MENTPHLNDAATAAAAAASASSTAPPSVIASTSARKPKVYISGSAALVWDVEGLPLRLLPEEVFALWDSDLVDLVDDSRAYREPTADEKADSATGATTTTSADQGKVSKNNAKSNFDYITLHTLSSYLPWFSSEPKNNNTSQNSSSSSAPAVSEYGQPQFWKYPSMPQDWRRSIIFKHLWADQQYFLAPGMKFGGDYLLYKKDPLVCHSSLIASIRGIDEALSLIDLANFARLASSVQKRHLLCSIDQQAPEPARNTFGDNTQGQIKFTATKNSVVIFAVEWAGF
ncbi:tRNA-splicing endonuclease subunit [Podila minutissima]|uniref:tRNA-intron lyase n=1 Tax=Podila minutissima TaxID=64525 RepID=A0A9P5VNY7_9FUNG|nr:tRNA-splicing endonuclease subunit [Podila minutissima]